ncbi:MAG TPA: hypothetical protein VHK01_11990 [Lacipirellulaceae bacterium]|jgi:hypothetical protein|nr:hypothetical protein [Lacipirellulaceae bacterium]
MLDRDLFTRKLAEIDERIAQAEPIANKPLGDKEQRLARIELGFLKEIRKGVADLLRRKSTPLKPTK